MSRKAQTDSASQKDAGDLVKGALVNYLGMIAKTSKVLFMFVAARVYGMETLGLYLLSWSVVDIASKFGLWGIDRSLIRDISRYHKDEGEANRIRLFGIIRFNIGLVIGLSFLTTVVVYFLIPLIAVQGLHKPNLIPPLRILVFAIPFITLTHSFIATTKALRIMKYEALIRSGLEPLVLLLGTLALIPFKMGVIALVSAHIFASAVAAVGAASVAIRKYRYLGWQHQALSAEDKKETLRYTSPIAVMDMLSLLVARSDILLVGRLMNEAAAGLYGIAVEIISVVKRIRQGFEPIFAPIVSELFYTKEKSRLHRNYVIVTRWLMAGSLLPALAMILYPAQLLSLFGREATAAAGALVVLAISHGLFGTFSAAESLLVMTGKTLLNTILAAAMLSINIAVSLWLIPKLGLVGAALGMLTAFAFVSAARLYHGYRFYGIHP
ncbi:MAG: hypothetical protein D6743_12260, partial [Calditrichaeota bacterium]